MVTYYPAGYTPPSPEELTAIKEAEIAQARIWLTLWLASLEDPSDPMEHVLMPLTVTEAPLQKGPLRFVAHPDVLMKCHPRGSTATSRVRTRMTSADRWVRTGKSSWTLSEEATADYYRWVEDYTAIHGLGVGSLNPAPSLEQTPRILSRGETPVSLVGLHGAEELDSLRYTGLDALQRAHLAGVSAPEEIILFLSTLPVLTGTSRALLNRVGAAYDPSIGVASIEITEDLAASKSALYYVIGSIRTQGLLHMRIAEGTLFATLTREGAAEFEAWAAVPGSTR